MKRSLHEEDTMTLSTLPCATSYEEDTRRKRFKRSSSGSGFAAMTLLSFALSVSNCGDTTDTDKSVREKNKNQLSPAIIQCDDERDIYKESNSRDDDDSFTSVDTPYQSFGIQCCQTIEDWKKVLKPLPRPPRLPQLPAGVMATLKQ